MLRLVTRRLVALLPLCLGAATLVFLVTLLVPGRPFDELAGPGIPPEAAEHLRRLFGADRSWWDRYATWLGALIQGDLGYSTSYRQPVASLIGRAAGNSLRLAGPALLLQFVLGVGGALIACARPGGKLDAAVRGLAGLCYATPGFVLGLGGMGLFAVSLGWLPVSQMHGLDHARLPAAAAWADLLRHLVLPCAALALPGAAAIALYLREELLATLDRRFPLAGRARGQSRAQVVLRHGLPNAALPMVQLIGLSLPGLIGTGVVVETLFAWPGMGRLSWQAVIARDEALVLGCTLVGSFAVILGSLLADVLAAWLDPRVRATLR